LKGSSSRDCAYNIDGKSGNKVKDLYDRWLEWDLTWTTKRGCKYIYGC